MSSDFEAFNNYLESVYPRVYAKVKTIVKDSRDVDEIMNDVRMKIFQEQSKLKIEGLGGWISKVAQNAAFNRKEKQKCFQEDIPIEDILEEISMMEKYKIPIFCDSTYLAVVSKENIEEIHNYIKQLPDKYSSLIKLRSDGCSYAEISVTLDTNINTVKIGLRRGREYLRRLLGEEKP